MQAVLIARIVEVSYLELGDGTHSCCRVNENGNDRLISKPDSIAGVDRLQQRPGLLYCDLGVLPSITVNRSVRTDKAGFRAIACLVTIPSKK